MAIFARIYSILIYSFMKKILITGGAGFIGSHVVRRFVQQYPHYEIFNLDKLTYAGNLQNLSDIEQSPNYHFIMGNIWFSFLDTGNLFAGAMMCIFTIMIVFIPANNQIFGFLDGISAFFWIYIFWLFSTNKIKFLNK